MARMSDDHESAGFFQGLRDRLLGRRSKRQEDGEQVYRDLRAQVLTVPASALSLSPTPEHPFVWAAVMDWHVGSGVATLVAILDGTVSMYLSSGGGIIGAGAHADVFAVARRFLTTVESHRVALGPTNDPPLPGAGGVRFIARTFEGTLASPEIPTEQVGEGQHALSPVFDVAQELIAVVRQASDRPRG